MAMNWKAEEVCKKCGHDNSYCTCVKAQPREVSAEIKICQICRNTYFEETCPNNHDERGITCE